MCDNADGHATITDGHVSYSGDSAWWVQEILGEDEERAGLRVVSRGTFDFEQAKFDGSWVASTGSKGTYSKFQATSVNSTMLDIPTANAVPEGLPSGYISSSSKSSWDE